MMCWLPWWLVACSGPGDPARTTEVPSGTDTATAATGDSSPGSSSTSATAWTGDSGEELTWRDDPRSVHVDPIATIVRAEAQEWGFGTHLAVGADLDKDGRAEWSVGATSGTTDAVVRVFEGVEVVAERHPAADRWATEYPTSMTHADMDGDGFKDVVFSYNQGSLARLQTVTGPEEADDRFLMLETPDLELPLGAVVRSMSTWPAGGVLATTHAVGTAVSKLDDEALGVASSVEEPTQVAANAHALASLPPLDAATESGQGVTDPVAVSGVGGDTEIWFGVSHTSDAGRLGRIWACGDTERYGQDVQEDCRLIATEDHLGSLVTAGDLDGDGIEEVASAGTVERENQGTVYVYDADGEQRAVIHGTRMAQLGWQLAVAEDAEGVGWLLVGQANRWSTEPASVFAFRGTDVHGELTEADAERIYVSERGPYFSTFEVYRETPESPPQLLLGHPADLAVYIVPFAPGEDGSSP